VNEKQGTKSSKHQGEITFECLFAYNSHYAHHFLKFALFLQQKQLLTDKEHAIVSLYHRSPYSYEIEKLIANKLGYQVCNNGNHKLETLLDKKMYYFGHFIKFQEPEDKIVSAMKEFGCRQKNHMIEVKYKYVKTKNYYQILRKKKLTELMKIKFSEHERYALKNAIYEMEKLKKKIEHLEYKREIQSRQKLYSKQLKSL